MSFNTDDEHMTTTHSKDNGEILLYNNVCRFDFLLGSQFEMFLVFVLVT